MKKLIGSSKSLPEMRRHVPLVVPLAQILPGTVPFVVAGASLLALEGGGLYWVVAGIVGAVLGAAINAWVLLVEILR